MPSRSLWRELASNCFGKTIRRPTEYSCPRGTGQKPASTVNPVYSYGILVATISSPREPPPGACRVDVFSPQANLVAVGLSSDRSIQSRGRSTLGADDEQRRAKPQDRGVGDGS